MSAKMKTVADTYVYDYVWHFPDIYLTFNNWTESVTKTWKQIINTFFIMCGFLSFKFILKWIYYMIIWYF